MRCSTGADTSTGILLPFDCTFSVPPDSCFAARLWIKCTSQCKRVSLPAFPLSLRVRTEYFESEVSRRKREEIHTDNFSILDGGI